MFKDINKKHLKEASKWFGFNFLGGLFPVYAGFFWLSIIGKNPTLIDFSNNGQFAIYTATVLAWAFYVIFKEYKIAKFFGRWIFGAICLVILIGTVFLFSAASAAAVGKMDIELNSINLIRNLLFISYFISLIIAYALTVLDISRSDIDIQKEREKDYQSLTEKFDKIGV